ncbi:MAG: capsule-associated protein CAP1 [Vezdaea aestivalis]|nr:MAG: capsule-associated protein CAP1 [Vezdaea aestivalis]
MARVRNQGSLPLALVELSATLSANLLRSMTAFVGYFTILSLSSIYFFTIEIFPAPISTVDLRSMRARQIISVLSVLSFFAWIFLFLKNARSIYSAFPPAPLHSTLSLGKEFEPIPAPQGSASHPVYHLVNHAETDFESVKASQSKTVEEAVVEYRSRYGISPPPNFDKWFAFAKAKNVQLVDEYDNIFNSILPFWGLEPATIRARTREALGFDNALIGLAIRDGEARKIEGGQEWQQQATIGMMGSFIQHLPDMDLAFNIHDEPRVVVANEDLKELVRVAKQVSIHAAMSNHHPKNAWSPKTTDLNNGKSFSEVKTTRFNVFAHQPTWTNSRVSCPASSPARSLFEHPIDNRTAYSMTPLGFIYNNTAFSDICNTPSFRETYGFFDRPNAFNIVHDLFPIFSQSKTSSFQDILYPSPWYWAGKVSYDATREVDWLAKENKMYWRGSTTGGFSRNGGWRRQHRQRIVRLTNARDRIQILEQPDKRKAWTPKPAPREQFKHLFDVRFSHVGQCDPGDCDAQRETFDIAPSADQQDAWKYKHLLDMDGNAFSGRFYAFLRSKSLVYKMAVFREWHLEWLKPWVHFVPLSLRGDEWVETVRWFAEEGQAEAQRVAEAGRDWAEKVLRKEDFEVYFFRLLLE